METIVIEVLEGGIMPTKAHKNDAAYDVFTKCDYLVESEKRYAIPLGFKMKLPEGKAAIIQPRSGLSLKGIPATIEITHENQGFSLDEHGEWVKRKEIRLDADVNIGLIDSNYTGEVSALVSVHLCHLHTSLYNTYIAKGTKIAQMRIVDIPDVRIVEGIVENNSERGSNGFGSTGEK